MVRRLLACALLVLTLLSQAGAAGATSCVAGGTAPANPYALAPIVFVGTVLSTSHGNRLARVRVEDVWRGPTLPPVVELLGSDIALTPVPTSPPGAPPLARVSTSDRHYAAGQRYLFVPIGPADPPNPPNLPPRFLNYGGCDFLTRAYTPDLAALRPSPLPAPTPSSQPAAGARALLRTVGPDQIGIAALLASATAALAVRAARDLRRRESHAPSKASAAIASSIAPARPASSSSGRRTRLST